MNWFALIFILWSAPMLAETTWYPAAIESFTYPALAVQARITGEVQLQVVVDAEGNVKKVISVSGHRILVDAARQNLLKWAFASCSGPNQPESVLEFKYVFQLEGSADVPRTRFKYKHPYTVFAISQAQNLMPTATGQGRR